MSISSRGEASTAGASLPVRAWRSGAFRFGFMAILAAFIGLVSSSQAKAQLTVKSLVGKAVSDPTDDKYPEIKSAIDYFVNQRDPKAAFGQLSLAKQNHPKLPPVDMMMADLWMAAKQSSQVLSTLEDCIKHNPNDPEAYLVLADMAFSERHVEEAELLFAKAAQLAETFKDNTKRQTDFRGRAQAGLAAVAESRQEWDAAKGFLQNWLKIAEPNGPPPAGEQNAAGAAAHTRLGNVLFQSDTSDDKKTGAREAYEQFQAALADDDRSPSPDVALASLYENAKMHDEAKKFITRAVTHPSKDTASQVITLIEAARWAIDTNQADDAFNYAQQASNLDPKSARGLQAKYLMGVAARMKGDSKAAEDSLQAVCLAQPANFDASDQLAQVLAENIDPEKKERGLEIAMTNFNAAQGQKDQNRSIEAASTLGWAYFQLQRYTEADQVTQAVINSHGTSPDIMYYQAKLFQDGHGQTKEAVELLRQAVRFERGLFVHRDDAQQLLARLDKTYTPGTVPAAPTSTPAAPAAGTAPAAGSTPAPANK